MRRLQSQCHCAAYRFPHRAGGGQCEANPRSPEDLLCEECGGPTESITADFGIGAYEYWGYCGVHRDVRTVSACCDGGLIENRPGALPARFTTTTGVSK